MIPLPLPALTPGRIAFIIVLVLVLGLFVWGFYWRGEAYEARAQAANLDSGMKACSAGVDAAKKASDAAMELGRSALAEIRKQNAPLQSQIARLEGLMKNPPPGADCNSAWTAIENAAGGTR